MASMDGKTAFSTVNTAQPPAATNRIYPQITQMDTDISLSSFYLSNLRHLWIALLKSWRQAKKARNSITNRRMWPHLMVGRVLLIVVSIVSLGSFWIPVCAHADQEPLKLDGTTSRYNLAGHLQVYEDAGGSETIEDILSKPFRPVQTGTPHFGFTQSVYWIKLTIADGTAEPQKILLEIRNQYLDFIDIFVKSGSNPEIARYRAGARVPFDERISRGRYPVVTLNFSPGEVKTVFFRVSTRTPVRLPLVLSTRDAHRHEEVKQFVFLGLFFGALVFLIIYSLFAWSILRQPAYLYYILTIAGVGANQLALNGLTAWMPFFSEPQRMLHLLTAGIGFTCVFNVVFVSSFMDCRAKYPILYRILDVFLVLGVIVTITYIVNYYVGNAMAMAYGPALAYVLAIVIGLMWYWGESHARYLFLAHVQLPIIGTIHVAAMAGLIPFNPILTQLLPIAYLWQGLFFMLALVDRYSIMQRRFMHELEDKVAERSAELVEANKHLESEIVERKRIEAVIARAKREWEQTFDTVPDLITIIDRDFVIHRINKAMADKMNLHPRDAIGRHCYELCHGTDEPFDGCPLHRSMLDDEEHSTEIVEPRLGGTFIVSVSPLPTDNHQAERFVHVARDITERKIFEERLRKQARTDSLTNIWNRRHFMQLAERELERTRRYGGQFALAMIDLDHFKTINDTCGHDVGDETLRKVAEIVGNNLRKVDVFARFGGEEFVLALPETDLEKALHVAERLRRQVADTPMTDQATPIRTTVSIGVTVVGHEPADLATALKQADKALYMAKRNGRNRVEVYSDLVRKRTTLSPV